jgi:hypothetical protein
VDDVAQEVPLSRIAIVSNSHMWEHLFLQNFFRVAVWFSSCEPMKEEKKKFETK